jgi:threonyl-tRNA synthetase
MAMAVQSLYPDGKVTIGPWIQHGYERYSLSFSVALTLCLPLHPSSFYYDFFFPERKFSDGDLKAIKKEMDKIIRAKLPIRREEVSREEARRRILEQDEPYKLELLDSIQTEPITIYHIGDRWWDLCAGPHVESTGHLNPAAISLQSVAGAYWKGDEKNVMLQVTLR